MIKRVALGIILVLLVLAAYAHVWNAGFIWDDDAHLTQNVCVVGPAGLTEIWTTAEATYYPLVLTTFWALHKLVGLHPLPYHAFDVVLHLLNALLLWRVLKMLNIPGAWMGATLWALHPVMVQSVAWVTETKNTQSCFFYLLTILVFVKWNASRRWWQLLLALFLMAAALASKTSTVVLPAVLALILWWQNGRLRWRDVFVLLPFAFLAAAASAWTVWEQKFHSGAVGPQWSQTVLERIAIAGCDVWFYLLKLACPYPLIFIYPRWKIDAADWVNLAPIGAVVLVLVVLWLFRKTWGRAPLFAFVYFIVALFPVLGFFDVYFFRYSFVSDHFQYLASMAPIALCGAGLKVIEERLPAAKIPLLVVLFGGLGFLTSQQTAIYHDRETLWQATLAHNPDAWIGHYELASIFRDTGDLDAAVDEYHKGLATWPTYADAHFNLASVYLQKGDASSAIIEYRTAIKLQPNDPETHNNLGNVLRDSGSLHEAIAEYETALRLQPQFAAAHENLARALLRSGETGKAIEHYRLAVEIAPTDAQLRANLAAALLRNRATTDATAEFERVLRIDGDNLVALTNLSWLLATSPDSRPADKERAVVLATRAVELTQSNEPFALHSLAAACAATGDFEKAIANAEHAYELALTKPHEQLIGALSRELAAYREGRPYQRSR
ncbi:MAG: tetratricopeptide repeat protein [Chthoniobacterales bacterium]